MTGYGYEYVHEGGGYERPPPFPEPSSLTVQDTPMSPQAPIPQGALQMPDNDTPPATQESYFITRSPNEETIQYGAGISGLFITIALIGSVVFKRRGRVPTSKPEEKTTINPVYMDD